MSTLVSRFEALYNELDRYMRERLQRRAGVPHTALIDEMATRDGYFLERQTKLHTFARLRNALVHNPDADRFDPIAEPHPGAVAEYEAIVRYLKEPPRALTRAIPRAKLFTARWSTPLVDVLGTMRANAYSLVPVVDGDHLEAVFLDCTLVRAFLETDGFAAGVPSKMNDLRRFIDRSGDQLGSIEYLPETATVRDAQKLFVDAFLATTALRAIFVTGDGTQDGALLGLLTGYDLLAQ